MGGKNPKDDTQSTNGVSNTGFNLSTAVPALQAGNAIGPMGQKSDQAIGQGEKPAGQASAPSGERAIGPMGQQPQQAIGQGEKPVGVAPAAPKGPNR
jgi:hypothetical protein